MRTATLATLSIFLLMSAASSLSMKSLVRSHGGAGARRGAAKSARADQAAFPDRRSPPVRRPASEPVGRQEISKDELPRGVWKPATADVVRGKVKPRGHCRLDRRREVRISPPRDCPGSSPREAALRYPLRSGRRLGFRRQLHAEHAPRRSLDTVLATVHSTNAAST
jgi:hypothetical protein